MKTIECRPLLGTSTVDQRIKEIAFSQHDGVDVIQTNAYRHFFEYIAAYGGVSKTLAMMAAARYLGVADDNVFLNPYSVDDSHCYYCSVTRDVGILVCEAEKWRLMNLPISAIVICPDGYVLLGREHR